VVATQTPAPIPTATPIPNPWFKTSKGETYIREGVDYDNPPDLQETIDNVVDLQGNDIEEVGGTKHISDFFGSFDNRGSLLKAGFSALGYSLDTYEDLNHKSRESSDSWFDYLFSKLNPTSHSTSISVSTDSSISILRSSSFLEVQAINNTYIYSIDGDLTISNSGFICNEPSIIFVNNLSITDAEITADTAESGCFFVVSGKTTITFTQSVSAGNTTSYHKIDAFIVTDEFTIDNKQDGDGVIINGGIIVTALNISLNGNLGDTRNATSPAEIFRFDTRYMYIYGDLLSYISAFQIRETQYINSIQ